MQIEFNPYYTNKELREMGFKDLGRGVLVSRTCRIYTPRAISLGNHVLIDDFAILNGEITLGSYVHIGSNSELYAGEASISMGDYSATSSRVTIYACSDDYSGASLCNPTAPRAYRFEQNIPVDIGRCCVIGTGSTILPGVTVAEGCSFGSMSLVNKSTEPWGIYAGIPAKRMKDRQKGMLEFVKKLENG